MNTKRIISLVASLALVLSLSVGLTGCGDKAAQDDNQGSTDGEGTKYTVGICQLVQHEALDAATQGFIDALNEALPGQVEFQNKNASGKISWRHSGQNNALLLSSPLGQGIAEITTNENGARLTTQDGQTYTAINTETLTQQVLGYPLPLAQLTNWVRGQRTKDESAQLDAFGRLLQLRHEGWRIDYGYPTDDPQAPPNRIFAESTDELDLRLLIDEWSSLPAGEWTP